MVEKITWAILLLPFLAGCLVPTDQKIPSIPKDHPANKFYQFAQQGMLSDKVCRDNKGDPSIPIGKIEQGEGYSRSADLIPGVFRFTDHTSVKKYLGVSYLQYSGMLQLPKVCVWEEKS